MIYLPDPADGRNARTGQAGQGYAGPLPARPAACQHRACDHYQADHGRSGFSALQPKIDRAEHLDHSPLNWASRQLIIAMRVESDTGG